MDESISVTSSGDSSGTSDDFEILDPTSPSSPITVTLPPSCSHGSATSRKVPSSRDLGLGGVAASNFFPFNASSANPKMLSWSSNSSNSASGEPQLAIANNGNIEDLQKQMSEVLRDAKSSSSDRITREDDPAILKSLDTSPESDLSSPVSKTGREKNTLSSVDTATASVALTTASSLLVNSVVTTLAKSTSSSNGSTSRGLSHPVREIVDHNHPLCLPPSPAVANSTTTTKTTACSKDNLSGGKSIPEHTLTASKLSDPSMMGHDNSSSCTTESSSHNSSQEHISKALSSASSSTTDSNPSTTTASSSSVSTIAPPVSATTPTIENPPSEEYTIFNRVLYLGAASISSACTQTEILHNMGILNSQVQGNAIEVSLSVPSHSEGHVIIYDALNKMEITKYHIYTIRRCTRGLDNTPEASCFTFTTKHGTSPATSIVQCHVFRCQIPEAVSRIVDSFGAAFRRVPKSSAPGCGGTDTGGVPIGTSAGAMTTSASAVTTSAPLSYKFDIALEIKEEDSKGNYYTVPRDKECFKLRCNIDKELQITVTPSPTTANSNINNGNAQPASSGSTSSLASSASSTNGVGPHPVSQVTANGVVAAQSNGSASTAAPTGVADTLTIERCFGLLIAPGHKVKHADMNLLEMVSMGHSSNGGPPATSTAATTSTNTGGGGVSNASLPATNGSQPATAKSYVVSGRWDPRDPMFAPLNQETPKDGRVLMSVAIDLVMKGIQEPVRFVLDTKVRVFPQNERFWYFTKKPLLHLFSLKLKQAELSPSSAASLSESQQYEVLSVDNLGEVERLRPSLAAGLTLPLTLSSLTASTLSSLSGGVRSPGTASVDTPGGDEDTDDDEPLLSGSGEVSKDCPQSELDQWKVVLPKWQAAPALFPKGLAKLVKRGVPEALRGEVWQLLAGCSGDTALMDGYRLLLTKDCPSDQVILRDINRTFPAHDFFKESGGGGQDALYKISRAYAVYDEELAYCQGLSFLAASLLLHMPEEQAFCVLVKIMSDYGFRNLFKDGFEVLHLRFYQLDRLMEDYLNDVHSHFQEVGVATHMFASQWFLTLYTAKFPLYMVFHYLDLFLLLGFDSVFQVAIALLMMSRKELVALDFEGVLKYFRVSLPKKYRSEDNVKQLFRLATTIKVKRLEKYQREYLAIKEQESSENVSERLEQENRRLLEEKLRLDAENDMLARKIDQLEESVDRSSREAATLKQALGETDQEKTRLMQEASQVKELLKREVERSDSEQRRSSTLVAEYKTICSQLSQRLEDEHSLHIKAIERIRNRLESCSSPGCRCLEAVCPDGPLSDRQDSLSSTDSIGGPVTDPLSAAAAEDTALSRRARELSSLSHQVRELELELAQTKLALVETQCKNQDVTHQLNSAITELQSSQNTWFQKTLTSITSLREKPANSVGPVSATGSSSRPLSPSLSTQTINSLSSLGSSSGGGGVGGRATVNRTSSIDSNSSVSSRKDVTGNAP